VNHRGAHNGYLYTLQGLFLSKKRFELKVIAVLLYAFGHSEKPLDSSGFSPSLKCSGVKKVEASSQCQAGSDRGG